MKLSGKPSSSSIADVTAVSVSPTWTVPEMVGLPEGGLLVVGVAAATASVGSLVSVSCVAPVVRERDSQLDGLTLFVLGQRVARVRRLRDRRPAGQPLDS